MGVLFLYFLSPKPMKICALQVFYHWCGVTSNHVYSVVWNQYLESSSYFVFFQQHHNMNRCSRHPSLTTTQILHLEWILTLSAHGRPNEPPPCYCYCRRSPIFTPSICTSLEGNIWAEVSVMSSKSCRHRWEYVPSQIWCANSIRPHSDRNYVQDMTSAFHWSIPI